MTGEMASRVARREVSMDWKWLSAWMMLLYSVLAVYPQALQPLCPSCGETLVSASKLETLVSWGDWHLGWRQFECAHCAHKQVRIEATRDLALVQYQTHPMR
jgi:hypothetical protein